MTEKILSEKNASKKLLPQQSKSYKTNYIF